MRADNINEPLGIHDSGSPCPRCGQRAMLDWTGEWCPHCLYCFACAGKGCGLCRDDPDADATAEYGPHPEGEARWQALQAEIAADAARPPQAEEGGEIPF